MTTFFRLIALCSLLSCGTTASTAEVPGADAQECLVKDNGDDTFTMTCPGGSEVTWSGNNMGEPGDDGADGSDCIVTDNGNGTFTMQCPNGSDVTWRNGADAPGSVTGTLYGSYHLNNSLDIAFLAPITEITGDLIVEAPGIQTLSLPLLRKIHGSLIVSGNSDLEEFNIAVTWIGTDAVIHENPKLVNFSIASEAVGNDLLIDTNAALTDFSLPTTIVGGNFLIRNLDALSSKAIQVEQVAGDFIVNNNDYLTAFTAPVLRYIGNDFRVTDNLVLTNFGVDSLSQVNRHFSFNSNQNLPVVSLPTLDRVGGQFSIGDHASLTDITTDPSKLEGGIWVFRNPSLTSLSLSVTVTTDLTVSGLSSLTSFSIPLERMDGSLHLTENAALASFSLPVTYIGNSIWIKDNTALTSLDLSSAQLAAIERYVFIGGNDLLTSFSIPATNQVLQFTVDRHPELLSFSIGFTAVTNDFRLQLNDKLATFDATAMQSIGQYLEASWNPSLCESILSDFETQTSPTERRGAGNDGSC